MFRAKKEKDKEKIADGYQMFLMINEKKSLISLKYADSIIYTIKELKENHYPSTGYMIKVNLLSDIERYNEALEAYPIGQNKFVSMTGIARKYGVTEIAAEFLISPEGELLEEYYFRQIDSLLAI